MQQAKSRIFMADMSDLKAIQECVREVVESSTRAAFIYDLLRAYDLPKASVTRLEKGDYNQAKADGEILWKNRLQKVGRVDSSNQQL